MNKNKEHLNVVCAVVERDGRYLCMQRPRKGYDYTAEYWEFPGGKIEPGECHHEALLREIHEEMDWEIFVGKRLGEITHDYPDFTITLTAYLCKGSDEDFKLLTHLDYRWLTPAEFDTLKWTDADRKLIDELHLFC